MTPQELAEDARKRVLTVALTDMVKDFFTSMADALIAQAELLEKYRNGLNHADCFDCSGDEDGIDDRCDLCRAYDAMMEVNNA